MNWKVLLFIGVIGFGAFHHFQQRAVIHGPGVIAPNTPSQNTARQADIQMNGFSLTPLEHYEIEARVLSREDYTFGTEAELSPTDLAVGWGPMSDEAILKKINISQGNRFYYWRVDSFPIPQRQIEIHSANMHIIPANDSVKRQLSKVRQGQLVKIKGLLVEAKRADGWNWRSSLSREDTGNGACELMYVTDLYIRQ